MAQATDYSIANQSGANFRAELNTILAAIVSQNSGSAEPTTTYAYQLWIDTAASPNPLLKLRNGANNAWITLGDVTAANLGLASLAGATFTGDITLNAQSDLRFADSDSSNWVAFQGPATVGTNVTWTLPNADGTSSQVLSTNGSGVLSWASALLTSGGTITGELLIGNTGSLVFEGSTANDFETTLAVTDPTADRTVTLPDASITVAGINLAQSFTAAQRGSITALTDGATITPDFALANNFSVTLGGNRTLANPTNLVAGQSGCIWITQDGTGSRTLSYGSYWDFTGGTAPTLTTTASAVDCLVYAVQSTTKITATLITNLS